VVGFVSLFPAIGFIFFLFAAGYPEAIFEFILVWGISYLAVSYVAYRLIPPKLVVRYFGSLVTLGLNDVDDVDPSGH